MRKGMERCTNWKMDMSLIMMMCRERQRERLNGGAAGELQLNSQGNGKKGSE